MLPRSSESVPPCPHCGLPHDGITSKMCPDKDPWTRQEKDAWRDRQPRRPINTDPPSFGEVGQIVHAHRQWSERRMRPLEDGARGSGEHRGSLTMKKWAGNFYPACSRHGAMNAVGGGKWRCLASACNLGAEYPVEPTHA